MRKLLEALKITKLFKGKVAARYQTTFPFGPHRSETHIVAGQPVGVDGEVGAS